MVRACKICKRRGGDGKFITLLSFPANADKMKEWATFCKVKCKDIKRNDRLCSLHFNTSSFKKTSSNNANRLQLKPDAVPTLFHILEVSESTFKKGKRFSLNCCLCGALNSKIPLFGFPRHDPETTKKWLALCGPRKQNVNVETHKVCLKHFKDDDFLERTHEKSRLLLKPGVVPSPDQSENTILKKLHKSSSSKQNYKNPTCPSFTFIDCGDDEDEESNSSQINSPCSSKNLSQTKVKLEHKVIDNSKGIEKKRLALPKPTGSCPSTPQSNIKFKYPRHLKKMDTPETDEMNEDLLPETPMSMKKRQSLSEPPDSYPNTPESNVKFKYPRHFKEMNTPEPDDVGSEIVKMILDIARKDLARVRQRSQKIEQQNRRLDIKILSLEATIKKLKKETNFSSEQSKSDVEVEVLSK